MALSAKKTSADLSHQKQDVLVLAADLRLLSTRPHGDEIVIDGFDASEVTKESAFRLAYLAPEAHNAEFNHKMVLSCLQKLGIVQKLIVAQDGLQKIAEEHDEPSVVSARGLRADNMLFLRLTENFSQLRNQQGEAAKPAVDVLRGYSKTFANVTEAYQSHAGCFQKTEDGPGYGDKGRLSKEVRSLRVAYAGVALDETREQITLVRERLLQVARLYTSIDTGITGESTFSRRVVASNLLYAGKALSSLDASHKAIGYVLEQISGNAPAVSGARETVTLGAIPLITP